MNIDSPCLALIGEAPHAPICLCDQGRPGLGSRQSLLLIVVFNADALTIDWH
jgi:hypothetical protein